MPSGNDAPRGSRRARCPLHIRARGPWAANFTDSHVQARTDPQSRRQHLSHQIHRYREPVTRGYPARTSRALWMLKPTTGHPADAARRGTGPAARDRPGRPRRTPPGARTGRRGTVRRLRAGRGLDHGDRAPRPAQPGPGRAGAGRVGPSAGQPDRHELAGQRRNRGRARRAARGGPPRP